MPVIKHFSAQRHTWFLPALLKSCKPEAIEAPTSTIYRKCSPLLESDNVLRNYLQLLH